MVGGGLEEGDEFGGWRGEVGAGGEEDMVMGSGSVGLGRRRLDGWYSGRESVWVVSPCIFVVGAGFLDIFFVVAGSLRGKVGSP